MKTPEPEGSDVFLSIIPGRAEREPGIHLSIFFSLDSGSPLAHRPE